MIQIWGFKLKVFGRNCKNSRLWKKKVQLFKKKKRDLIANLWKLFMSLQLPLYMASTWAQKGTTHQPYFLPSFTSTLNEFLPLQFLWDQCNHFHSFSIPFPSSSSPTRIVANCFYLKGGVKSSQEREEQKSHVNALFWS